MATMTTEIHALAERCRKVGWKVVRSRAAAGGWRITAPDGWMTVLHATPSSQRAILETCQRLDEHGLSATEAKQKAERTEANRRRNAEDAKAAEAKAAKMAKQAAMVARAAGLVWTPPGAQYAGVAEDVPLEWFLFKHTVPWMRWVRITPELAAEILKRNTDNRPMNAEQVAYYRRIIEAGGWRLTHQGMAMDTRGVGQDLQHRLQACVDSGIAIETAFFVGMDPDNFKVIDEGKKRSAADLFGKDGETNRPALSATIRLVAASREPFPQSFLKQRTPNAVIYDEFKGDPESLRLAVHWGKTRAQEARMVAPALGAARYLLLDAHETLDNAYVSAFLSGLVTGCKGASRMLLDAEDPRTLMRDYLQKRREAGARVAALDQLSLILWAWEAVLAGRKGRGVRWVDILGRIPAITVCHDTGPSKSAPPERLHGEIR